MNFSLATGVGKTRLMGAMMAYLYLGRQTQDFLLLAPRATVLRKFEEECQPGSSKYIFVDTALVPEPRLWTRGNLESFDPSARDDLFQRGPNIAIFSPQSITGQDRRANRESEFTGTSLIGHLQSLPNLIVLTDEAHHIGKISADDTKAWTQAIRDLSPKLYAGMTATPRQEEGANVAYNYDLKTCLEEKLYTKDVRLIVRQKGAGEQVSDDEWDRHTLDFALDRLARKEAALAAFSAEHRFPKIQPVLLVCAENTSHANRIGEWLIGQRGLSKAEVLVTHSEKSKSEEELSRLVQIERPDSPVRVVVNVYELTEGWDVTNVYVIAPLRRMGTFQGAIQTMGRGLRLPAGRRVDDSELDTLDVLCFGKQSLQEVLRSALHDFGDEEDAETFIQVRDSVAEEFTRELPTKRMLVPAARTVTLSVPVATRLPVEPDLNFDVSRMGRVAAKTAVEFDLTRREIAGTADSVKYDADVFIRLVSNRVTAGLRYLSAPLHKEPIEKLVRQLLEHLDFDLNGPVSLDWIQVSEILKDAIDEPYRRKEIRFEVNGDHDEIQFGDYECRVPEKMDRPIDRRALLSWEPALKGLPICGWSRCVSTAAAFDTRPEYRLAEIIDSARGVEWWIRNSPAKLKIATPIGNYEPDFVLRFDDHGRATAIIIEVKQGEMWHPPDSDPRIKARATDAWCEAIQQAGAASWKHWVVLDSDMPRCNSLDDLLNVRINQ